MVALGKFEWNQKLSIRWKIAISKTKTKLGKCWLDVGLELEYPIL